MARPLATIGFTYISTLIAATFLSFAANFALSVFFIICAFVLVFAFGSFKYKKVAAAMLFTSAAALLMFCAADYFWYEPAAGLDGADVTVNGYITDLPQQNNGKYYYIIQTTNLKTASGKSIGAKIRASFDKPLAAKPYDSLSFKATLYIPADSGSGYSSKSYYRSKGIYLFTKPSGDVKITVDNSPPIFYYVIALRQQLLSNIYSGIKGTEGALAAGILLGDTSKLPDKVKSDFTAVGVSHILAVSGTQTSLIAMYLLLLLTFLRVPRKLSCIVSMAAVFVFMAVTAFSPSVTRAGIMSMLFLGAMLVGKEADALNSLGASVLLLCLVNPFAATDTGLLLSFTATLGMITVSGKLNAFAAKIVKPLPKTAQKIILKPAALLSETTGASLLTLPIIILTFGQVSVVALISNMVEVPLALVSTLGTAVIAMIQPIKFLFFITVPIGFITNICCRIMIWFASLLASLPFATVSASYGYVNILLIFILFTAAVYLFFKKKGADAAVCVVCCCFMLSAGLLSYTLSSKGVLQITSLAVGNGNCTVLIKDGKAVVVGLSGYNPETQVASYLKQNNIKSISALVLSGYSDKCVQSANNLLEKLPCEVVYSPESFSSAQNRFLYIVKSPLDVPFWNDVKITLYPDKYGCIYTKVLYKSSSAAIIENKLQDTELPNVNADVLIFNASVTYAQAKQLKPEYAVADGSNSALYSCANFKLTGSKLFTTQDNGIISILTRGNGLYMIKRVYD